MSKSCVICGSDESDDERLVAAPCQRHWVCPDDVASFFENATSSESLFPPKCCEQIFLLDEYEAHVPFDTAWAYQVKQQGEYATLAKFRVYCANPPCNEFLHPATHIEDKETNITYAICESEDCGRMTCVTCKRLLTGGVQNHICKQDEDVVKFKQTATEQGYQECNVCGAIVELAEACNHITCGCGNAFCYVCGKEWPGIHGCPHYGSARYDDEGYNQDGYHGVTGLNRAGLSRRQEHARLDMTDTEDDDDDEFDDDEFDDEFGDEDDLRDVDDGDWDGLQHLEPEMRALIASLPDGARSVALNNLRVHVSAIPALLPRQGQDEAQDQAHVQEPDWIGPPFMRNIPRLHNLPLTLEGLAQFRTYIDIDSEDGDDGHDQADFRYTTGSAALDRLLALASRATDSEDETPGPRTRTNEAFRTPEPEEHNNNGLGSLVGPFIGLDARARLERQFGASVGRLPWGFERMLAEQPVHRGVDAERAQTGNPSAENRSDAEAAVVEGRREQRTRLRRWTMPGEWVDDEFL